MSRNSQGLQAALIVLMMLSVVLGVTTCVFFRQYHDADRRAETCAEEATALRVALNTQQAEICELKRLIGFSAGTSLETVQTQHAEDMDIYAAGFPEENRFYRPLLVYLGNVARENGEELASAKQAIQDLKDRYEQLEDRKQRQVQRYAATALQAWEDLHNVEQAAREARDEMAKASGELIEQVRAIQSEADAADVDAQTRYQELQSEYEETVRRLEALEEELAVIRRVDFTVPDGRICLVNYHLRTAWIDLGRADSLERHVNFNVYPAEALRLNRSTKKGQIEVTKVLEDHLAEARVIDEVISDPILRGDKIHTPLWNQRPR